MPSLQPVRGTHDLLFEQKKKHNQITSLARTLAARYGFSDMMTPIFEFTEVFQKTIGETTDIVTKEMYTFEDKGGESLTLRPELTASAVRALISNGLFQDLPVKFFYSGPMFRYERPQKGRMRQFHQIGVEFFGIPSPQVDAETIALGYDILTALGLEKQITLELNSLGDRKSYTAYRTALKTYFLKYKNDLSDDSKERLEKNPMRILDSKDEKDKKISVEAPKILDHLNTTSASFFNDVQDHLQTLKIPFKINPLIVRGLDYYTHSVFEFTTTALGAQGTVLAGGRYDGLVEQMGGRSTPAVGWAAGIERLAELYTSPKEKEKIISIIPAGDEKNIFDKCLSISHHLRKQGFFVDMGYSGNLKKRLQKADKIQASFAVIVGEDEMKKSKAIIRDLSTGDQTECAFDTLEPFFKNKNL